MLKYDVSIIVAVYNNEKYIENCIKSILKQVYPLKRIQLILVNDGSKDNSLNICNKYAKRNENILVINQKNQGVSAARNAGISAAEGKYIMILDSDDTISLNTVKNLVAFFDKHYDEIDLVTYPMINVTNKSKTTHFRYGFFDKGTGVYDLEEYPYICQSNVNVIIKNKFKDNILYNTEMFFSEDEEYNTRILVDKLKIGYCAEARYYYTKTNETSAINTKANPYYCFESLMEYHENMVNMYLYKNRRIPKYVQAIILNDFRWRIKTDELFPYYCDGNKYKKEVSRIINLVKRIDDEIIINNQKMSIYHKIYFLKLKKSKLELNFMQNGKYEITCNGNACLLGRNITIVFDRLKIKNGKINILAYIRSPIFEIENYYPNLFFRYEDENNKIKEKRIEKYFISNKSFFWSKMKTNNFYGFELNIKMEKIKKLKFLFKIENHEIMTNIEFSRFCPFNKSLKRYKIETDNKIVRFNKNKIKGKEYQFFIKDKKILNSIKLKVENLKRYIIINKKIKILRCFSKTRKKIWLYTDRKGIIDNAYYQFRHDLGKDSLVKRYYIYDGDPGIKNKNRYMVKYGSLKHKILFLKASKVLTSFSSLYEYCPLSADFKYYRDLMKYDLVYLQHGILHANLLKMYSKEFTEIDKIVVSSEFEKNNFIKKYNYNEKDIIACGMPRLQAETSKIKSENRILFAPSWRKYLIGEIHKGKRMLKERIFVSSEYFIKLKEFLNSEELRSFLEKNNLKLDFQLHPIFRDYENLFKIDNEYVNIVKSENIGKYKILITDFSSFQFDFAKLKRPIIYYVPDIKEFKAGLHSYRELDLPYEKAFGKLTLNKEDLIENIKRIVNNNFKDEDIFLKREEKFFINLNDAQDNLYRELMREE